MIGIPPGVRILIAMQPVDFRRGADSLAALAKEVLQQDPFSGTVLVFRAKRADRVKVVAWDGSGLVNPCSPNLCEAGRIEGCRQCRRAVGAGALDGDVPWKPATWTRRSQPGPRFPRPVGASWAS
jgi:transposase